MCYTMFMQAIFDTSANFADLRKRDCIYVDKTMYLHRLITDPGRSSFLFSRPRRFGKSLMLSTLESIFMGRRDLFKGLYIDTQTDYAWPVVPVIHLDFSDVNVATMDDFRDGFSECIEDALSAANYSYDPDAPATTNFKRAVRKLSDNGNTPIAVLVDEYDAPIDHALDNPVLAKEIRACLAPFYASFKKMNGRYIRFMLMTGVARFTKFSVFSSLNSPVDLSTEPSCASMLGYTETELDTYFSEHMHHRAAAMRMPYAAYREELRRWFNGYRFTRAETKVYNPVSIAQTLTGESLKFEAPWTRTGRPQMLSWFLKTHDVTALPFESGITTNIDALETSTELDALDPIPMLYQTGYLTISEGSLDSDTVTLRFPDEEVRRDMYRFLADIRARREGWCLQALAYLEDGKMDEFLTSLTALYAAQPSHGKDPHPPESHYQSILHTALLGGGFLCQCECAQSSRKRCDIVAETPKYIYIFELKRGKRLSAKTAVKQIIDRDYAAPHRGKGKPVIAVGLVFHPDDRTLRDTAWEPL